MAGFNSRLVLLTLAASALATSGDLTSTSSLRVLERIQDTIKVLF